MRKKWEEEQLKKREKAENTEEKKKLDIESGKKGDKNQAKKEKDKKVKKGPTYRKQNLQRKFEMMGAHTPNIRKEKVETDDFMMYKWNLQDQMLRQK